MNSAGVCTGRLGGTTNAVGSVAIAVIAAKSFNASYERPDCSAGLMASAPESDSISTWPSGLDLATTLPATTPPAPGMFSTTNGLPSASVNFSASRRPSTSGLPPGPAGAIRRTGRFG